MTGGPEGETGPEPSFAWCNSTSVGNKHFEFQWQISDYQRKKESVKRDDSIQSSTFAVQVVRINLLALSHSIIITPEQWKEVSMVPDLPAQRSCRGRGGDR